MKLYRERYIENGQMFVRFMRQPPRINFRKHDIHGNVAPAPTGFTICSPNNWMRRLFYFFNAPRWMIRSV